MRLVKRLLTEEVEGEDVEKVEVNTVDQYQGRDKMAIICSFVRSGKSDEKVSVCVCVCVCVSFAWKLCLVLSLGGRSKSYNVCYQCMHGLVVV